MVLDDAKIEPGKTWLTENGVVVVSELCAVIVIISGRKMADLAVDGC